MNVRDDDRRSLKLPAARQVCDLFHLISYVMLVQVTGHTRGAWLQMPMLLLKQGYY